MALALAIELLIVALLLTLGMGRNESEREFVPITAFDVGDPPAPAEQETAEPQPEDRSPTPEQAPEQQPEAVQPEQRRSALPPILALDYSLPPSPPAPIPTPTPTPSSSSRIGVVVRADRTYGPVDTGNPNGPDSERVGTAPDGSPLYAARWFREPGPAELAGYLSAATSPGWGLIACRTAPNWRVEDCEIIDEYPANSGIARAVQAAAWQFQVRPPRIGGQYQVGSWVRIRIDYTNSRRIR